MKKRITTKHSLGVLLLLLLSACATQKSRYDQSKLGKLYHDITAKYNGYFNANELLEQSILTLDAQCHDNYTDILELYKYRAADNPQAVASDLDEAIKKVSIVSTLHETSQWDDDCYLLIGKAFYLKQDFESAQNALEFFMDEFNPDGTHVTKKKPKVSANKKHIQARANKADSARKRKARAKAQERARKQYNKQVRKRNKKSERSGDKSSQPTERKTARDNPPPPSLEKTPEDKSKEVKGPGTGSENPGGLKHKPAYQEAQLWLARTYVERENYPAVERILNSLRSNPNLQDEIKKELPVVSAYYALHRGNYAGAIPSLESAIELADKKADKARMSFILGQIAEKDKEYQLAVQYYQRVLDYRPDYTLSFNAKLNTARATMEAGTQSVEDVTALLSKMLKDDKNAEYQDQIYFTLGQLYLGQHNIPAAIENLQLAAQNGAGNPVQLTETNYLLAGLYFDQRDYINAKVTYDATLTTMPETDERYREVLRLSKNLTDIAMHLTTIAYQDSLLRVSNMTDDERLELARQMQKNAAVASSRNNNGKPVNVKDAGTPRVAGAMPGNNPPARPAAVTAGLTSKFFAYDQKEVKKGLRDFEHDWGDRPLGDNWRVAALAESGGQFEDLTAPDTTATDVLTDQDLAKIFRDVPDTDEKRAAAEEQIQNAMLQLGSLYRDKLEDYQQSIDMLNDLLSKYPDTKYALDAYYQLYLSYYSLGDQEKAEYYKNKIITEYASSKYAMVLIDPDYLSKQMTEEQRLDKDYQEVYQLVEDGKYEEAKNRIDAAKSTFGTNHKLQAKYSILEAMCIGNLQGKDAYIEALKAVIGGYPGTPEEIKARDMLLLLDAYAGSRLNLAKGKQAPDYKVAMDAQHFVLVQVTGFKDADAQDVNVSISNYNRKYHNLDKLKISSLRFDTQGDKIIILVRSFKDGEAAMKYINGAKRYADEFIPAGVNYEVFAVTQENYREIVSQKSLDSYKSFYEENYH